MEIEKVIPKTLGADAYIYRMGTAEYFYPNVPFYMMVGVKNNGTTGDYCRVELCDDDTGAVLYTSPDVYIKAKDTFLFVSPIAVNQTTAFHGRAKSYHGASLDDSKTFTVPYRATQPIAEITAFNISPNPVPKGDSTTVSITAKNIGSVAGDFCIGIYSDQHGTKFSDWFWVNPGSTFQWSRVLSGIEYSQICMPIIWWWNGTTSINVDEGLAAIYLLPPVCGDYKNQTDCEYVDCYWWNGICHAAAPTCEELNNQSDCERYGCYWYDGSCHVGMPGLYERYPLEKGVSLICIRRNYWYAQTFTVGNTGPNENHTIDSVRLYMSRFGSPGIITLDIHAVDGDGKPTGSPLCSVDYDGNTIPSYPADWIEFIFPSPAVLLAGMQYAMVISAPYGDGSNHIDVLFDNSYYDPTSYTGGFYFSSLDSGSSWSRVSDHDFVFEEYGTPISLPELCTWLADHGAPSIIPSDVPAIINSYLSGTPPSGYAFVPVVIQASGVIDYCLGMDGDAKTGCEFFP